MLQIVSGNIFDTQCECIGIQTNSEGVLATSELLSLSDRFRRVTTDHMHQCMLGQSRLRNEPPILLPPVFYDKAKWKLPKHLIMIPAQTSWESKPFVGFLGMNLAHVFHQLTQQGVASLALPLFNCDDDFNNGDDVLEVINRKRYAFDGTIEVYRN